MPSQNRSASATAPAKGVKFINIQDPKEDNINGFPNPAPSQVVTPIQIKPQSLQGGFFSSPLSGQLLNLMNTNRFRSGGSLTGNLVDRLIEELLVLRNGGAGLSGHNQGPTSDPSKTEQLRPGLSNLRSPTDANNNINVVKKLETEVEDSPRVLKRDGANNNNNVLNNSLTESYAEDFESVSQSLGPNMKAFGKTSPIAGSNALTHLRKRSLVFAGQSPKAGRGDLSNRRRQREATEESYVEDFESMSQSNAGELSNMYSMNARASGFKEAHIRKSMSGSGVFTGTTGTTTVKMVECYMCGMKFEYGRASEHLRICPKNDKLKKRSMIKSSIALTSVDMQESINEEFDNKLSLIHI
eukprot:TRINITY_DN4847_c0_g1_i3.p2 TRINITY_DN4847_c0_g1~~TRINITY_DN4847_c0_g1_i3.p2  ORF type:complete len:356 (-),score=53.14 TRINITY_DN4847_c0_g1_i3:60-1127(-)